MRDKEFRFYLLFIALAIVVVTGDLASREIYSVGTSFRHGSFQVVSMLTTTGFTTTDYGLWPHSSQVLLVLLMLFGGCLGSTSGALKMTRVLVILKSIHLLLNRSLHRRGVFHVRLGDAVLSDEQVSTTATYVLLYAGIIALGTLLLTFEGVEPVSSVSATITCIGNVGPGLALVGPGTTFAALPVLSKVTLAIIMWLGRLEILGCLLLFSPRALLD
jgi:trk system potassium uptake protein TrkH